MSVLASQKSKTTGPNGHRYAEVADRVAHLIDSGAFAVGTRIPSVRMIARDLGVAVTTAVKAYDLLEAQGLIEARPQSGYYVLPQARQEPSAMRATKVPGGVRAVTVADQILRVMEASRDCNFLPLGMAVTDTQFIPAAHINRAMSRAVRRDPAIAHEYHFPPGYKRLRVQFARHMLNAGVTADPNDILVTNGGTEAVLIALRCVTKPGDVVVIQGPIFFGLLQLIESLYLKTAMVTDDPRSGPSAEAVLDAVRQHKAACVLLMPTCSNPIGSTMPTEAKERVVRGLEELGVPLIEDDVWGYLPRRGRRGPACKAFDRTGTVLYASSLSKWLSPGLRLGWLHAGKYGRAANLQKMSSSIASAAASQMAAAEVLASGGLERHIRRMRTIFAENTDRMTSAVIRSFPAGTSVSAPSGGYTLWIQMPPRVDGMALFEAALIHGVGCAPGPIFSPHGKLYSNCIRLNCGLPWSSQVERAIALLGGLAAKQLE